MATRNATTGRKTTIEIPIPSIRRYVPGSGPPAPRISLAPPRDSTAYIIDQFVLPTEKDTAAASRRLIYYHVGFTDLPAAKILIPCNKVLDYVSPRELEDWEYQNAEKSEEERARERTAKKPRRKAAKKGTKNKAARTDEMIPATTLASPADEALLLTEQVAGPSLSTPQKRKFGQVLDEEDTGEASHLESDDAAIQRQLQRDAESESMEVEDGLEEDSESVDQLAFHYETSDAAAPCRAGRSAPPPRDPFPALTPTEPNFLTLAAGPSALSSSSTCTPQGIHPAWAKVFRQHNQVKRSVNPQSPSGRAKPNGFGAKTTPGPNLTKPQEQSHPLNSFVSTPSAGSISGRAGKSSEEPMSGFSTPIAAKNPAFTPSSTVEKGKRRALETPPKEPSQKKQSKKRNKKRKQEMEQEDPAADEWEVKELLDDQWVVENGVKVHKYLVLWAGDWPEDQNPTWEPDENVQDENLITRYQKKKAGLLKRPKKSQVTLHQYLSRARYTSVAEAFEAGIDEQAGPEGGGKNNDAEGLDETFLVTENARDFTPNGMARSPSFRLFDDKLARYVSRESEQADGHVS